MDKTCDKCGSDQIVTMVSAASAVIPDVKEAIMKGTAEIGCCRIGVTSGGRYRCKNCGFEWDTYYEIQQQREKSGK